MRVLSVGILAATTSQIILRQTELWLFLCTEPSRVLGFTCQRLKQPPSASLSVGPFQSILHRAKPKWMQSAYVRVFGTVLLSAPGATRVTEDSGQRRKDDVTAVYLYVQVFGCHGSPAPC